MTTSPTASQPLTPRDRRRLQTREEILDVALDVMAENGVAALNLTQVAQRVGLRQPSLYQYFRSRTAVYDALFERGMQAHHDTLAAAIGNAPAGWPAVRAAMAATLKFAARQPALAQLLFTRAVPGFVPSVQAYDPSLRAYELVRAAVTQAVARGDVHRAAASDRGLALLLAIVAGVASQQAANDPGAASDEERLTTLLYPALDMYAAYFRPNRPATWMP